MSEITKDSKSSINQLLQHQIDNTKTPSFLSESNRYSSNVRLLI